MPLIYALPTIILFLLIGLLLWGSYKAFQYAFASKEWAKGNFPRRIAGSALGLLLLSPLVYPFVRDAYRNHLCDTEGGGKITFNPDSWKASHPLEIEDIRKVGHNWNQITPDTWRELLNSRFAEDIRNEQRGLGVMGQTYRLVDVSSNEVVAQWTKFVGDSGGGRGLPLPSFGLSYGPSCSVGASEYFKLRSQLAHLAKK